MFSRNSQERNNRCIHLGWIDKSCLGHPLTEVSAYEQPLRPNRRLPQGRGPRRWCRRPQDKDCIRQKVSAVAFLDDPSVPVASPTPHTTAAPTCSEARSARGRQNSASGRPQETAERHRGTCGPRPVRRSKISGRTGTPPMEPKQRTSPTAPLTSTETMGFAVSSTVTRSPRVSACTYDITCKPYHKRELPTDDSSQPDALPLPVAKYSALSIRPLRPSWSPSGTRRRSSREPLLDGSPRKCRQQRSAV